MDHHSPDKDYIRFLDFYDRTNVVFGNAAFTQLSEEMLLDNCNVMMLIRGQESAMKSGAYEAFINMAFGFEMETPLYNGVPAEPDVECVRDIVRMMETMQPAAVAALGGGSVMDAAKAAYLSWQTGLDVTELFGVNAASQKFPDRKFKRVICIPTTAGTGSEVTPYANIVDKATGVKCLIAEQQITPELALVDPDFTHSMPNSLTAATALDAMTHAVESYLNCSAKDFDPMTEQWALESIKLIRYALPKVLHHADDEQPVLEREMLAAAATLAGMCITARPTALPHLCSYSLWGKVPHGLAVALFLPMFWKFYLNGENGRIIAERTMKLAGLFPSESPQKKPEDVIAACASFVSEMSGGATLPLDEMTVKKIAEDAVKNPAKLATAPRQITVEDAEKVLTEILKKG